MRGDFSLQILRNWLGSVMCETQLVRWRNAGNTVG